MAFHKKRPGFSIRQHVEGRQAGVGRGVVLPGSVFAREVAGAFAGHRVGFAWACTDAECRMVAIEDIAER